MKSTRLPFLILCTGLLTLGAATLASGTPGAPPNTQQPESQQQIPVEDTLRDWTIQTLSVYPDPQGDGFMTAVDLGGELEVLELTPYSMRGEKFKVIVVDDDGEHQITPPAPHTFRGTVEGRPGSRVAASLVNGRLSALVHFSPTEAFAIQPWDDPLAESTDHIVYSTKDVTARYENFCGNTDAPAPADEDVDFGFQHDHEDAPGDADGPGPDMQIGVDQLTEVAIDIDFPYYQQNSSSVVTSVQDAERLINGVEDIYQADVGICWNITTIIVRTTSGADPYSSTSAGTLLNQFQNYWNNNHADERGDQTHLLTGRNLNGGTIGIANCIGCTCNRSQSFALSQAEFTGSISQRIALVAHEIGHVYDASHCCGSCSGCSGCQIMCPCLGGCSGIVTSFGSSAISQISSHRDSRGCLDDGCDEDMDLVAPVPGEALTDNVLTVRGGNANENVEFFWAKRLGTDSVAGCGAILGLDNANSAGVDQANGFGTASITVFAPSKAAGATIRFQAVGLTSCKISEVVTYTFP